MKTKNRNILILIILFVIFFIPFLVAFLMYNQSDKIKIKTVNYGNLIRPPVNIKTLHLANEEKKSAPDMLTGKWTIMYLLPKNCDETCKKIIYNMRQIRQANGKDIDRIQRAVVIFSNKPDNVLQQQLHAFPETKQFYVSKNDFQTAMSQLNSTPIALKQGYLYLVDPLGNIMMGYTVQTDPTNIFKDLQKLLRVSQIG